MGRGPKRQLLEATIVTLSTMLFAGAIGAATWAVLGQVVPAAVAGIAALACGRAFVELVGGSGKARAAVFVLADHDAQDGRSPEVPDAVDADVLLLDDPLPPPGEASRVVRLFETDTVNATPGQLLERIGDFIGQRDGAPSLAGPPVQPVPDASAELYAALANIRASLR